MIYTLRQEYHPSSDIKICVVHRYISQLAVYPLTDKCNAHCLREQDSAVRVVEIIGAYEIIASRLGVLIAADPENFNF